MPYFLHNACTSVERVTTTRCNPSVTANARQSSGFPSNSASSLLEPNRFARPDAMITHPISLFIGEKLRIELFSCLFAGVTILLIAIEKLLCLVGEYAAAAAFAADHGVYLIRKGHWTVAAAPDGRLAVNTTGNDGMAKGGSGDVLTGLLTGLLAQGMEPFDACCAAVWIHGRAGDMAAEEKGRRGMTPADMIEKLPYALKEVE